VGRALRDRPRQPAQRRRPGHLTPGTQRRPPRPSRRVPPPPDQPERLGPQRPLSGPQTLSTPRWLSSSTWIHFPAFSSAGRGQSVDSGYP
jgi:hypothetical protein